MSFVVGDGGEGVASQMYCALWRGCGDGTYGAPLCYDYV